MATIGPVLDEDGFRWAEALAIERVHGADGPRWIAERTALPAVAGVARFGEFAQRHELLLAASRTPD